VLVGGPRSRNAGGMGVLAEIFLFEEFRLDRRGEGLSRRDERGVFVPVSIGIRALDVLGVLVDRAGELVLREEIMTAVWGRTVVENANLTVQISALRRVLDPGGFSTRDDRREAAFRPSLCAATGLSRL
jgi:DNA-binding winged helix-turn-helix (wHTH) protein